MLSVSRARHYYFIPLRNCRGKKVPAVQQPPMSAPGNSRVQSARTGHKRTSSMPTGFVFKGASMRRFNEHTEVPVTKGAEGPIPSAWRPTLKNIVDAFARHDYRLANGVAGVAPVSEETATQIHSYIQEYGAKLVPLPQESWATSVCIWYADHWDALIDLWTEEEGPSDLVLQVQVSEIGIEPLVTVHMVYVP